MMDSLLVIKFSFGGAVVGVLLSLLGVERAASTFLVTTGDLGH